MSAETSLRVTDLAKHFDAAHGTVEVLRGIDFTIDGGESVAVTGPSGSGKSTLLHVVGTLEPPSRGRVEIDGIEPFALSEPELARFRNAHIGFIFQDHHLLPHYSVLENVLLPTLAYRRDAAVDDSGDAGDAGGGAEARARELLDRVGLGHRLRHRPAEISGGERQRAAVARALINRPSLLLCDEPTGSLDRKSAGAVADLLGELHAELRAILIVVTHDLELAGRFGRRLELRDGRLAGAERS